LNRRRFPRISFPCLIVFRSLDSKQAETVLSHTENVGVGGLCLILKQSLEMFSEIDIEIDLMDLNENIKCRGKVVWCVRRKKESPEKPLYFDTGIEYVNLKPADKIRLETVINKLVREKKDSSFII
jgi:c-di-GMP-binding flagellar brake protein YcgR